MPSAHELCLTRASPRAEPSTETDRQLILNACLPFACALCAACPNATCTINDSHARLERSPCLEISQIHSAYGMVWHPLAWKYQKYIRHMVWYGMVWYSVVWYGMVWYGTVWYGICTVHCGWYCAVQMHYYRKLRPSNFYLCCKKQEQFRPWGCWMALGGNGGLTVRKQQRFKRMTTTQQHQQRCETLTTTVQK